MVDHQAGEQLSFVVHPHPDARDGWLDATVGFVPIMDKGAVVGQTRVHKAKVGAT